MSQVKFGIIVMAFVLSGTAARAEGSVEAGIQKIKRFHCLMCHGRDGMSKLPEAPNLAGQVQPYMISALQAYRSEARKNETMNTVAEKLTDADISDLTAYYSSLVISVTPPPKP